MEDAPSRSQETEDLYEESQGGQGLDQYGWDTMDSSSRRYSFRPQAPNSNNEAWGENVMVSGCVSGLGMCPRRRIQGIMDKFQHEDILENTMRPHARNSFGLGFIFQQDNDPKHRSKHI
ncbi:Transposable element Tcb2 transposase [Araneus ventricosus]|uniref:Transposable element Tcb2 transposase n=1 Tax=Araneus ventricosus TaxID=182803 RepID=A0A4Y2HN10_ARAVE|nr:Transposable element Tcb2 transposase [Araneus ventricosus]